MFNFGLKKEDISSDCFTAVSSGKIIPLEAVKDETFSSKVLGDGVAIDIDDDYIVAPCDGTITMLYPTLHAFGILTNDKTEILVHIGIDTVGLKGKGFKKYVNEGDSIKRGDKIIRLDSYFLRNDGYDLTTMMLFPNCNKELDIVTSGMAKKGKTVVANYRRNLND